MLSGPVKWPNTMAPALLLDAVGPEAMCVLGIESLRNRHFLHPSGIRNHTQTTVL